MRQTHRQAQDNTRQVGKSTCLGMGGPYPLPPPYGAIPPPHSRAPISQLQDKAGIEAYVR